MVTGLNSSLAETVKDEIQKLDKVFLFTLYLPTGKYNALPSLQCLFTISHIDKIYVYSTFADMCISMA